MIENFLKVFDEDHNLLAYKVVPNNLSIEEIVYTLKEFPCIIRASQITISGIQIPWNIFRYSLWWNETQWDTWKINLKNFIEMRMLTYENYHIKF